MEKQVTGPSAVQVAVLKTSLQEEKKTLHMSTQENDICQHLCEYEYYFCQKFEKTLH